MMMILKGIFCIIFYLGCYICAGTLFPVRFHKNSLIKIMLLGYMVYFTGFQLVALPMKIGRLPLKYLTLTWYALIALLWIFVLLRRYSTLLAAFRNVFKGDKESLFCRAMFLIFAVGLAVFLAMNLNHISDYDAGYYLGLPASSVYSNTIERMDPYTGRLLEQPDRFYILNTITIHSAVTFQALNLPPLVEAKFSFTIVLSVLFVLILYEIGRMLFDNREKNALVFVILSVMTLLFSYSISGVSHYFAYRTYEGKSICSYLYMTAIFMFFLAVYGKKYKCWGWTGLFFSAVSGISTCNTALFTIPILIATLTLPCLVYQKRRSEVKYFILTILPCLFWLALHHYLS